jgi:hypothetical protein
MSARSGTRPSAQPDSTSDYGALAFLNWMAVRGGSRKQKTEKGVPELPRQCAALSIDSTPQALLCSFFGSANTFVLSEAELQSELQLARVERAACLAECWIPLKIVESR